jgi:hypothetical protein
MAAIPLIRTSERGDLKSCEFYWWHHWQNGLTGRTVPTWAWFGTAIHKALEVRYPIGRKRGGLPDVLDAFVAAVGEETGRVWEKGGELDDDEVHDGKLLGIEMLKGYVKHWGLDTRWHVIHTEQPFQIDVRNPRTGRLVAVYCGTWDLFVWDDKDKVYRLVDHKTRAQFKKDWSFFNLNDQAGSYQWVAPEVLRHMGLLGKNEHIDGIVFNMLRKAMPQPTAEDGIRYNLPKRKHFEAAIEAERQSMPGKVPGSSWVGPALTGKESLPMLKDIATKLGLDVKGDARAVQPTALFERYTTHRGIEQRVNQGKKVLAEATRMDLIRRGKLPLLKHPTEDCVRCRLFDFCQLDEIDPERAQEYAATMLIKTDPYADHREAMQENGYVLKKEKNAT